MLVTSSCTPDTEKDVDEARSAETTTHAQTLWVETAVSGAPYIQVTAAIDGHELVYGGYQDDFEMQGHRLESGTQTQQALLGKLDLYGGVEWLRDARSPDSSYASIQRVSPTADGGAVVLAVAFSSIDLGCGDVAGRFVIARMSPRGECVWSRRAGDAELDFEPYDVAVGPDNRVMVSGIVLGTVQWDGVTLEGAAGEYAPFVMAINEDGVGLWGHVLQHTDSFSQPVLGIDNNWVTTVAMAYKGTIDGQTADGTDFDLFVEQLSAIGAVMRTRSVAGWINENVFLDVGYTDDIAIAGRFKPGTLRFDGTHDLTNSSTTSNTFLVKYGPDLSVKWTKKLTGGATISLADVRSDYLGYVDLAFVAYSTRGSHVYIGSSSWLATPKYNSYVARFGTSTGSTQWARRYGDENSMVMVRGMGTTYNGRVLIAGFYDGTPDLGLGPLPPVPAARSISGFVARIHQ